MLVSEAAHLASQLSNTPVSDEKIRRLCRSNQLSYEKKAGMFFIDEDSVRAHFG